MAAQRWCLLRLLPQAGLLPGSVLVLLQCVLAAMVSTRAVAVSALIAVLSRHHEDRELVVAAVVVGGLLLVDQGAWLGVTVVRPVVVSRIDGAVRATVRTLAAGLPTLDRLEDAHFQDRASQAVDAGTGVARNRSPGSAVSGQIELTFRLLSALAAGCVLATFAPVLAVALFGVAIAVRAIVQRQWMAVIDVLDADTLGQREQYYVSEQAVYGAAKDVRMYGLAAFLGGRFAAISMRVYGPVWRAMARNWRRQRLAVTLTVLSAAVAMAIPARAVLAGELEPARLVMYVIAAWGILEIATMGFEAYDIEYGLRGIRAADELTAGHRPASAAPTATDPAPRTPEIRFENVFFTYPGATRPALNGLSLTMRPGETVAVVGENGAGKTTFVKLLAGLYRPDSGRITIDGAPLADLDPGTWRRELAVLFQDFVRYPATLRDNVGIGAGPSDDADILAALERAGAADLPAGLDTLLWREGTGGIDLSGGQWQRVALARVLRAAASGRRILVLDEPTAHLDVRAEADFHDRVVASVRDATKVLISHRLSTVRPAERIVLLRDGRVAEDGSHDELMTLGGDYARFFTVQAAAFAQEAR
ncbi:ABC transporter ATP-binding protein [Actinoplanes sp. NPDC026619]|uniref:ABC transporter ATP-binding protein n=1 Tax=Actinoplanes sp. NPDC026619 TaxID=3155798 RepID=UPI0033FEEA43